MSYFNEEQMQSLLEASDAYKNLLEKEVQTKPIPNPRDPYNLTFGEASSLLQYEGWGKPEDWTDENFVLGYMLDPEHPERLSLRHTLAEEIPIDLDPDYEPSLIEAGKQTGLKYWNNLQAAVPAIITGAMGDFLDYMDEPFFLGRVNWKKVGVELWNANPDGAALEFERAGKEHDKFVKNNPKIHAGQLSRGLLNLDNVEDFFHERAAKSFKAHMADPKVRAYLNWQSSLTEKDLLPFTDNPMSMKEKVAYLEHAVASPLFTTGVGVAAWAATGFKNPGLGMRVAQSSAFFMEASDQYEQSMTHFTDQGYSPSQAGRLGHGGVMGYGLGAFYIERLPWSRVMPKVAKKEVKNQLWRDIIDKTTKKLPSVPGINTMKKITNAKTTRVLTDIVLNATAESIEEGSQNLLQMAIQSGYTGEYDIDIDEIKESMRAGFVGGGAAITAGRAVTGLVGRKKLEAPTKGKPVKVTEPTVEIDQNKLIIAKLTRATKNLSDQELDQMADLKAADMSSKRVLAAVGKVSPEALVELGLENKDVISAIESIFPESPEHALKARKILEKVPIPEKEEAPVKDKPEPKKEGLAALGFATDEELGIGEEVEEITAEVGLPVYNKMKKAELQAELGGRGEKVAKSWTKQKLIDKLEVLDEAETFEEAEVGEEAIFPEGILEVRPAEELEGVTEAPVEDVAPVEEIPDPITDKEAYDEWLMEQDTAIQEVTAEGVHPAILEERQKQQDEWMARAKNRSLKDLKEVAKENNIPVSAVTQKRDILEALAAKEPVPLTDEVLKTKEGQANLDKLIADYEARPTEPTIGGKVVPPKLRQVLDKISKIAQKYIGKPQKEMSYRDSTALTDVLSDVYGKDVGIEGQYAEFHEIFGPLGIGTGIKREAGGISAGATADDMVKAVEAYNKTLAATRPADKPIEPGISDEDLEANFQRIAEGRMPLVEEKPLEAKVIREDVVSKYPAVKLVMEKIVTDEAGIEVAGKALGVLASWSEGKATWDTAPHEILHLLTEALASDPVASKVLNKAYKEMGGKEKFHQYAGEYYATRTLKGQPKGRIANLKTALRKFWVRVKKLLGKPAEYVAEQYFEKGKMFEGADIRAGVEETKTLKKKRQLLINEASFQLKNLKDKYGVTIKRHPSDPTRLGTIKVPKSKRRQGIGRQIVDALKKEFIGKGKDTINIEVNPGSEGFWERMGFKFIEETREGYPIMPGENTSTINPPTKPYGRWLMQYIVPAEDMILSQPFYQRINENNEAGRTALRMLDNAFNAMRAETGKKIPIGEFVQRLGSLIPSDFVGIFDYWRSEHNKTVRNADLLSDTMEGTAINEAYANAGEFDEAFDRVVEELNAGIEMIEPTDTDIKARNGINVEYAFLNSLGIDIPQDKLVALRRAAWLIKKWGADNNKTEEEMFSKWANDDLYKYIGFKHDDFPDSPTGKTKKRRIKQMYVRALSTIPVNTKSFTPRHRNLEYNISSNAIVIKGETNAWSGKTNDTRTQNMMYEATGIDKDWNTEIVWLHESDVIESKLQQNGHWGWSKSSKEITEDDIMAIAQKALEIRSEADNVDGLVMLGVRGDAGHLMFIPIRQRHKDIASNSARLITHWKKLVDKGTITKEQARQLLGFRLQKDGTWKKTKNAFQQRWLAGEIARMEAMLEIMPPTMINNGQEFMRRSKIMSTPVFASPLMKDFKAVIIADGKKKEDIVFEDRNGNRARMVEFFAGMNMKNRTDGASIGGQSFFNNFWNAFGANEDRKLTKNVIWNKDLKLAVKHETFMPEPGMKIYSEPEGKPALLIAEVDNDGNIFNIDGDKRTQVDLLMTDDEAKYSSFKSGEVINIAGNEFGLIKYHEKSQKNATFPHQWLNYVQDTDVLNSIRNNVLPRVKNGLNRLFTLTDSKTTMPNLIYQYMNALRSDSPHAITSALVEKAKLGLGLHPDASRMLNKLFQTRLVKPALKLSNGKGTYVDLAPDYFGTHAVDDVSLAISDADEVFRAYADKEGGTVADAKKMGARRINQWLEENPLRVLVSRSPIPFVGGIFVGNVKGLHERGGQVILSDETVLKRLEGDWDGDAVQVEFTNDAILNSISAHLDQASNEGRMKPINLDALIEDQKELNDLTKIENVYALTQKFQKGSQAIGQIANVQNIYGQLSVSFNYMQVEEGFIRLKDLTQTIINFDEAGIKNITMEQELRMWLQAAVDNGKYLLLDKWKYSQEKLLRKMFALTEPDGTYLREVNDEEWKNLLPMIQMHKLPGRIRNGRQPDQAYTLETILQDSNRFKQYTDNRENFIREKLGVDSIEIGSISFNDELAPLEEIAVQLASMWYGNEKTGQEAHIEPGKNTPVQYADGVYNAVHLQAMNAMEELKYQGLKDAIAKQEQQYGELSESEINEQAETGHQYAIRMWTAKGKTDGTGAGFLELLNEFNDEIGPQAWDHNPELLKFTEYWSDIFESMGPIEQFVATYTFLQGFYQYSKQQESESFVRGIAKGKVVKGQHRNVLPPVSDNPIFTVLNAEVMADYLAHYNSILNNVEERMATTGVLTNYERFSQLIKKACK